MLEINNLTVKFKTFQLENINLSISDGSYFVILGQSGSGKTILLETICGLNKIFSGNIILDGKDISSLPPQNRPFGYVPQDNMLFPHINVFNNIAFPLKCREFTSKKIYEMVNLYAEKFNISHLLNRKTNKISGGEKQRIALCRALITEPSYLLLDEPLSSIDKQLKKDLINILKQISSTKVTIIQVTHDYQEALALSDSVAIIEKGKITNTGKTLEVFNNPKNKFIASLTGINNFYKAEFINQQDTTIAIVNSLKFIITQKVNNLSFNSIIIDSNNVVISEHNNNLSIRNNFKGTIISILRTEIGYEICIDIGINIWAAISTSAKEELNLYENKVIWIAIKASSIKPV